MTAADRPCVTVLIIRNDPPCRKCRATATLVHELAAARPGQVAVRVIKRGEPEAQSYGPVLTPMVVVNGKVVCAGMVPVKGGMEKLLERELVSAAQ